MCKKKINAEDCRTSSESTCVVLHTSTVMDTGYLTATCHIGHQPQVYQEKLQLIQVSLLHFPPWRKLHSPAQLSGTDCTTPGQTVGLINERNLQLCQVGEG
jgi:hypothetical protein